MPDQKIKIDVLYGIKAMRPDWAVILVDPPKPSISDILLGALREVVSPALLFALAFTTLKFALLGHF